MLDEGGSDEPSEVVAGVASFVRTLQRHLRAVRSGEARALQRAADEVFAAFEAARSGEEGLVLRLAADGLYLQEHLVAEVDPEQDEAFFRLFRHGVRRIGFDTGLDRDEVAAFLEVASTDFDRPEHVEDDVSTLLEDRGLAHVQLVVVETFVEGDGETALGSFDLASFVEAAVRPALREGEDLYGEGGRALPLWSADARFFKRAEVSEAIEALSGYEERGHGVASSSERKPDSGAFTRLTDDFARSEVSLAEWLIPGAFDLFDAVGEEAAERLADLLAVEVHRLAEGAGLTRAAPLVRQSVEWVAGRLDRAVAVRFAEQLFAEPLMRVTLRSLGSEETRPVALDLLQWFPEERAVELLEELLRDPPGPVRSSAFAVLLTDSPSAQRAMAEHVHRLDAEEARLVLEAVLEADEEERVAAGEEGRHYRPRAERVAMFEAFAVHDALPVRLRSMRWLAEHAGAIGRQVLARSLRAPEPFVRLAARYLLAAVRRREAADVLASHLQESAFDALPYEEKLSSTLLYAWLGGERALETLRQVLARTSTLRRAHLEERRAAAVVALGWLADEESAAAIFRLAKGRGGSELVRREAQRVVAAVEEGTVPCPHPREALRDALRASGIGRWVARRRSGSGQVGASLLTGSHRAAAASSQRDARAGSQLAAKQEGGVLDGDRASLTDPRPLPRFSFDTLPVPPPLWSEEEGA